MNTGSGAFQGFRLGYSIFRTSLDSAQIHEPSECGHVKAYVSSGHQSISDISGIIAFVLP